MADINMTPLGGVGEADDRFLVCEGMAGIKKCSLMEVSAGGYRVVITEYPEIGHSLPAVIPRTPDHNHVVNVYESGDVSGDVERVIVGVIEYGGQPDPDYFNITGVDERGNPTYSSPK